VAGAAAAAHRVAADLPLPLAVRRLLGRCLAAHPTERPTADAVAGGLAAAVAPRRRWVMAAVLGLAVVTAASGAGWRLSAPELVATVEPAEPAPPTDPFALGHWHLDRGQPALAIQPFLEDAKTDTTGRADECLAYCYAATGSEQPALVHADKAIAAGRYTPALYATRAAARFHRARYAEAITDCERAFQHDPGCTAAKLTRVLAVLAQSQRSGQSLDRGVLADLEANLAGRDGLNGGSWLVVAQAYVTVADPTPADDERAVKAVRWAVRAGVDPEKIHRNRTLHGRLQKQPEYDAALATPCDPQPPTGNPQLVRPVP
jgi:tetratricopeptide (TPR) repeat protein